MKMNIFAHYDKKLCIFGKPFFEVKTKEIVIEENVRVLKSGHCHLQPQMLDLDFYFLGVFDDKTCEFDLIQKPEYLFSIAENWIKPVEESENIESA